MQLGRGRVEALAACGCVARGAQAGREWDENVIDACGVSIVWAGSVWA